MKKTSVANGQIRLGELVMRVFKSFVFFLGVIFCVVSTSSAESTPNRLDKVFVESTNGTVVVHIRSAQPVGYRYTVYDSIDPIRVVVDLWKLERLVHRLK